MTLTAPDLAQSLGCSLATAYRVIARARHHEAPQSTAPRSKRGPRAVMALHLATVPA